MPEELRECWDEPVTAFLRGAALQFHLECNGGACESDQMNLPALEAFSR